MSKSTGSKGRGRNRNNSGKRSQGRSGNFDPNGGRNRGNAQQLMDKYLALARDAASQGDRIAAENYFQHADHYYRVVYARNEQQQEARRRSVNNTTQDESNDPIPAQVVGSNQGSAGIDKDQGNISPDLSQGNANGRGNTVTAESGSSPESTPPNQVSTPKVRRSSSSKKTKESDSESSTAEPAE